MTWHEIKTAPTDGQWVLLFWPYVSSKPFVGYERNGAWLVAPSGDTWTQIKGPTHWMALPDAPTEKHLKSAR